MDFNKQFLKTSAIAMFLGFSNSAIFAQENAEPNGNYTYAGISLEGIAFATPVCVGSECHKGIGGLGINFAYQIIPNIAISLSGASMQSTGRDYTLKSSGSGLYIALIAGIGSAIDVAAVIGSISSTANICTTSSTSCASYSDTGSDLGLYGKLWLNEGKNVNIGLSFDKYSYSKQTISYFTTGLSFSVIPANNHEFDISVSNTNDSEGYKVSTGYKDTNTYLTMDILMLALRPRLYKIQNRINITV